MSAKILFFDIETAPNSAYVWSIWNEVRSMDFVTKNWYVLCWAAKWLGEKEIYSEGICDNSEDDSKVMAKLWKLVDEADIVVAHNAVKFDCRRLNTRFIANGMTPPSPYRVVDTLKQAKNVFFFTSNRLNDLGQFFNLGKKVDTGGFELWKNCMKGDRVAWDKMMRYCKQDVRLLERVYKKLLPFMKNHPNIGVYSEEASCTRCGSKQIVHRGHAYTNSGQFKRYVCKSCGGWGRYRQNLKETKPTQEA